MSVPGPELPVRPGVTVHRWRGEAALSLSVADLEATFLPDLGMLGAALRYRGVEVLAVPGGLPAYKRGNVAGLPLLAPWANRLGGRSYRAAGVDVDLAGLPLHTDDNGLPVHGTMTAQQGWEITSLAVDATGAEMRCRFNFGGRPDLLESFPFPHELGIRIVVRAGALHVATTVHATGERPVPVSFGYHPYFTLAGAPRRTWRLGLPPRQHLELDSLGLPTGAGRDEPRQHAALGTTTFDDLFALGEDRAFTLEGAGRRLSVRFDDGYPFAQVFAPPGKRFVCLEPMTAPTNALVTGGCPLVEPGATFQASFTIGVGRSG